MKRSFLSSTFIALLLLVLISGICLAQDGDPNTAPDALVDDQGASLGINLAADPMGTALNTSFTYQGSLLDKGAPVNDTCDFIFTLWDDATIGVKPIGTNTHNAVSVEDGIFTVSLDFGTTAFKGDARWLGIEVDCGHTGSEVLSPRQPLTAAPYALGLRPGATVDGAISSPALTLENTNGHGLQVSSDNADGIHVISAGEAGVYVDSAGTNGVTVGSVTDHGLFVESSGHQALYVDSAGKDGLYVCHTGSESTCSPSSSNNGVEIGRAEDSGVFVGYAGGVGVAVEIGGILWRQRGNVEF